MGVKKKVFSGFEVRTPVSFEHPVVVQLSSGEALISLWGKKPSPVLCEVLLGVSNKPIGYTLFGSLNANIANEIHQQSSAA